MSERNHNPANYFDKTRFIPKWLADDIMKDFVFKTNHESKVIYCFEDGYYHRNGETLIQHEASKRLEKDMRKSRVSETVEAIRYATYIDVNKEKQGIHLVNLKNGLLDINKMEIQPHTPEYFIASQLPVEYNPIADCPTFNEFILQTVGSDNVPVVQELFGYCLYRTYILHKAFLFYGPESTGKSTLLQVIQALLGHENTSAVSLHDITSNRFMQAELYGKLANIHADLPDIDLERTDPFKQLVGGDKIKGEKKFGHPFYFYNHAKLIFSCNQIPKTPDTSGAFFRRWILIPCLNQIPEGVENPLLTERLTKELSGILNWALQGLHRLLLTQQFVYGKKTEQIRQEYLAATGDTVAKFVIFRLKADPHGVETKQAVYDAYVQYCAQNKLVPLDQNWFGRELKKHLSLSYGQTAEGTTYKGIQLK
ncbi:hypothetical protein KKB40_02820 [Patescibacteria group bacterium]|nr:hypothetical protein [Patescibacteria group bacterium]